MSNESKIDLSNSKRPDTAKINVVDEYNNERSFSITGELPLTIYVDKKYRRMEKEIDQTIEKHFLGY